MDSPIRYLSAEIGALRTDEGYHLRHRETGAEIVHPCPRRHPGPGAAAIMIELSQEQRLALGLPACEALTGGTALCLAREDALEAGQVELPRAPTSWGELVTAEVWPLRYLHLHPGFEGAQVELPGADEVADA